jgi:hypothetical protein
LALPLLDFGASPAVCERFQQFSLKVVRIELLLLCCFSTPLLGYGAPHLSARGTSTLLNNALLSARFRFADHTGVRALRLES